MQLKTFKQFILSLFAFFTVFSINVLKVKAAIITPSIKAKGAIVIDEKTGQILASKNADKRYPIASISKLLIAYLVEKRIKENKISLNTKVKIPSGIVAISQETTITNVPLSATRSYTIKELLEDALLPSGNGAAIALGAAITGSVSKTETAMEKLLSSWNIKGVKIYSPAGLTNGEMGAYKDKLASDDAENKLSAKELAEVSRHLMLDFPSIRKITDKSSAVVSSTSGSSYTIENTNQLLKNIKSPYKFTGIKTGSAESIGGNFIGETRIKGQKVITVVLGSGSMTDESTRFVQTVSMLSQLNKASSIKKIAKSEGSAKLIAATGKNGKVKTINSYRYSLFVPKKKTSLVYSSIKVKKNISYPLSKGKMIGYDEVKTSSNLANDFLYGKYLSVKVDSNERVKETNFIVRAWRQLFFSKSFQTN
ncbi:D-alanyl-D-alanine carboxypeptidase family protein [Oenococcus oeni]|uniref:Peptidase S11 D-alanyl-D-alanine carboxypeptidase A N-terminal domain-containing protein n=1 Tax=Oenococcus oeni AWRIB429 TaxID=655225 RepID=D3L8J5_OENOE|nr:serine hydrolase [Oenococcus oeni]EFD88793.1 hypothetical protein AWRIB429_0675 [Oenococcus oeni AWRIB429]KGH63693.1 D-alanyl-D-alanine carboxypeptidase [Oenococcus oeni IOEB_CiNe]EJN92741.1 D-alanyl-D-alanine carboxypeptidase [Oenococcus oeni AWRIB304]EJO02471.1 D-alanyl-D-alanine carboxypeptidase [Oenococcus oeni AWRIB318]EJO10614.1 D-alanyl-D-alanine carboxypeptidase [Oenococcus oeni AWRIB576]